MFIKTLEAFFPVFLKCLAEPLMFLSQKLRWILMNKLFFLHNRGLGKEEVL